MQPLFSLLKKTVSAIRAGVRLSPGTAAPVIAASLLSLLAIGVSVYLALFAGRSLLPGPLAAPAGVPPAAAVMVPAGSAPAAQPPAADVPATVPATGIPAPAPPVNPPAAASASAAPAQAEVTNAAAARPAPVAEAQAPVPEGQMAKPDSRRGEASDGASGMARRFNAAAGNEKDASGQGNSRLAKRNAPGGADGSAAIEAGREQMRAGDTLDSAESTPDVSPRRRCETGQ